MKKLYAISVCLLFVNLVAAQVWEDNLMRTNVSPTIQERSEAFEAKAYQKDSSRAGIELSAAS